MRAMSVSCRPHLALRVGVSGVRGDSRLTSFVSNSSQPLVLCLEAVATVLAEALQLSEPQVWCPGRDR